MPASGVRLRGATIESIAEVGEEVLLAGQHAQLGPVTISAVTFSRAAVVDCDDVGAHHYVHLPVAGHAQSRYQGAERTLDRDLAGVFQAGGGHFHARWTQGCRSLCVMIESSSVSAALGRLLGSAPRAVAFDPVMPVRHGHARAWVELLASLRRQLAVPGGLLSQPLVVAPLADSLVNGFLLAARHSCSAALAAAAAPACPRPVRMAVDLMEAEPLAPWTVSALAGRCGVGVRALQGGFRAHLGTSPMAYLRDVRLRRAHEDLLAADPETQSVAAVARRWGFTHLGRFASAHQARYGQTPLRALRGGGPRR